MEAEKLQEVVKEHGLWLADETTGKRANLTEANLTWADLTEANLTGANLTWADLTGADLTRAKGIFDALAYITNGFETTTEGIIVYKFQAEVPFYTPNPAWKFEPGSILTENVNPLPTVDCACGVNVATREWCEKTYKGQSGQLWRCIIRWPWAVSVVVPYNTDGKIRCAKVELLGVVS